MEEVKGNLWHYPADFRVITTNSYIRGDGRLVMGRGVALQAANKFRKEDLELRLGNLIKREGNNVYCLLDLKLITFPVKHYWWNDADFDLIKKSALQLKRKAEIDYPNSIFVMPRAGCGNGRLSWNDVKPFLEILPDNVKVISYNCDRE